MSQNQTQDPSLEPNDKIKITQEDTYLMHKVEVEELVQHLPKATIMGSKAELIKYQNFWFPKRRFKDIFWFKNTFEARDTDLIIASPPKCGTTWLKSILFAIVNRTKYPLNQNPLLSRHPHALVYRLEDGIYGNYNNLPSPCALNSLPSPRLLNTHLPYTTLPKSIKASKCRVLFIGRNPLDTCVSQWHFFGPKLVKNYNIVVDDQNNDFESYSIQEYFEEFLDGKILYGPYFEHLVEYWKMSLERPDKVLFLKYEDLKNDPIYELKRVAEFIGMPFSSEEENGGVINDIIELCSINNLKDLDANKNGEHHPDFDNKDFFRKGEVGDWTNYFNPLMVEKMRNLMQEKFEGTGLTFKLHFDP